MPTTLDYLATLPDDVRASLLPDAAELSDFDKVQAVEDRFELVTGAALLTTEEEAAAAGVPFVQLGHSVIRDEIEHMRDGAALVETWSEAHTARLFDACADYLADPDAWIPDDPQTVRDEIEGALSEGRTITEVTRATGQSRARVLAIAAKVGYAVHEHNAFAQKMDRSEKAAKARRARTSTLSKLERKVSAALEDADFSTVPPDRLASLLVKITEAKRAEAVADAEIVTLRV